MARITRAAAGAMKRETASAEVKQEAAPVELPRWPGKRGATAGTEDGRTPKKARLDSPPSPKEDGRNSRAGRDSQAKKLRAYAQFADSSPFPDFAHPTAAECKRAHSVLAALHGARRRPATVVAPASRAGCGDAPSVLDALVRTILSQNTSDANSSRAKQSMDRAYGGSDRWTAIVAGGAARLQQTIRCGGLSASKSRAIFGVLTEVHARYGAYSLDHLHAASSAAAMQELLGFRGVGPKTASCVLLFCLRRASFAVDTHVYRIAGLLGWRPATATRDETHQHLEVRIPDEDKYGLHVLMVTHGKRCAECRAGGQSRGACELRRIGGVED